MKIGIMGPADRAVAWEKHLRPHQTVKEVIIAGNLSDIGEVDACLLLDESDNQLEVLLKAIRSGFHSFLISPLPTDLQTIEKVYHTAEEANVILQFSHWPTLAPASQWMTQKIRKPAFIQIIREISHTQFLEMNYDFDYYWIDELAYCLKWMNGNVHRIDFKTAKLRSNNPYAFHLFLRFDSGATASVYINCCASENKHQRFAADSAFLLDCNVHSQTVRFGKENDSNHLFFEKKIFDASETAESAATQFIKAIQLNKPSLYNGYDLLKLANGLKKIKTRVT